MLDINLNNQNDHNENIFEKKTKRNFLTSSLATVLLILVLAIASVVSYLPIRNIYFPAEADVYEYLESSNFVYNLANLTRRLQKSVNNDDDYDSRYENIKSVKYIISPIEESSVDIEPRTRTFTNMPDLSESILKQEIDKSILYIKITFDERGYPTVISSLGEKYKGEELRFNKNLFISNLTYWSEENLEAYANLEVEYIIPQDFGSHKDVFTAGMKDTQVFPDHAILILIIGAVGISILTIVAFAVPYEVQRNMGICRTFNTMFLEMKFFTWLVFIGLFALAVSIISDAYGYYGYSIANFIYDVNPDFYLIGIVLTFLLYFLIYLNIVYLKYIHYKGFNKGVIDNSLCGRIFLRFIRSLRETLKSILRLDLREDNYRKLMALVGINLLAIWILGSGRFLGFILSLGYTFLIFRYLLRIFDKAKELNDASRQIVEGNFNIQLSEDMGILSPMAKNLNNINEGFSLAVEKEIKSQRMKSELISNVSHDLKTPLTSIITYVDLLKNEDIDLETQNNILIF